MRDMMISIRAFERYIWLVASTFFGFIFIIFAIRFFIFSPARVGGPSMEPNFYNNDLFFVDKISYLIRPPKRYDVVQVIQPEKEMLLIKRVIGLPGETIIIKRGKVYLKKDNFSEEQELDESKYLNSNVLTKTLAQTKPETFQIGANQYFVLGDNRPNSGDSRNYGPFERSEIIGKVYKF